MKKAIILLTFLLATSVSALVIDGNVQVVEVKRGLKEGSLIFRVDGKNFSDAESCGKYCYKRSKFVDQKSVWSNEVNIKFALELSKKKRDSICESFVKMKTYPEKILVTFKYTYKG